MGLRVWAEIDLEAIRHNLTEIKKRIGKRKIAAAVKSDAYGHGAVVVSKGIEDLVDFFLTATVEEAVELQDAGVTKPILVLGVILDEDEMEEAINRKIRFNLAHIEVLRLAKIVARKLRKRALVHMEVDTGMTRTGFDFEDAISVLRQLSKSTWVVLEGFFTHFSTADVDLEFAKEQLRRFNSLVPIVRKLFPNSIIHAANSAAIFRMPDSLFDMVRPGISIYGLPPDASMESELKFLKPAMSLKTRVIQIRSIKPGVGISYGRKFRATRKMRIATLGIGYGDGYPRILSNRASFLIRGKPAKVTGTICMDLTMVDVTDIPDVKLGEEAVGIGKAGNVEITATQLAALAETINYEIVTRIGKRAKRIYKGILK